MIDFKSFTAYKLFRSEQITKHTQNKYYGRR